MMEMSCILVSDNPELTERIFNDVGNIDYIYTVIQDCVNEVSEEQYILIQQELEEVDPPDQSGPLPLAF